MLDYREIRPRAPVSHFVECFWTLTGALPAAAPPERILPDGSMELVLNCAAPFRRYHARGVFERQPLRMLVGQMDRHILIASTGRVDLIGVRFHPSGARAFLRPPMEEFAGRILPLADAAPSLDAELTQALDAPPSARIARIEALLMRRIAGAASDTGVVDAAVRSMLARDGRVSVDALAGAAGLSPRQLERRFLHAVGLGPKRLARILRFQRVFRAVAAEPASGNGMAARPNWAAVAVDCGYYDQAHLIRDFHAFAGEAPAALFSAQAALTHHFTRRHRAASLFSNTLA